MNNLFEEKPSEEHKDQVLRAVRSELNENKRLSKKRTFSFITSPASYGFVAFFGLFLYFQYFNPLYTPSGQMDSNLIIELAALSPLEREVVEDLDFLECLDRSHSAGHEPEEGPT